MNNKDIEPKDENGLNHGLHIYYYNNGHIMYKQNYYHGKYHGICESYFSNGNLCTKCNFKMHKLYSLYTQYNYKSGEIEYKNFWL